MTREVEGACHCGFCRAHGAGTVADPEGDMAIRAAGEGRAVANAVGLAMAEFADREASAVVYDGESAPERIARRAANWTPARLLFETPAAA